MRRAVLLKNPTSSKHRPACTLFYDLCTMRLFVTSIFALLFSFVVAQDETPTHGEGEEGSSMGPVAFLWPPDRAWSATSDNTPPCGSSEGPSNRTLFPLSQGSVALSIADDAWKVAFRLAVSNGKLPSHLIRVKLTELTI